MSLDELRKAIEDKSTKLTGAISAFDLDFAAHVYLSCLYLYKVENKIPVVLDNIRQIIPLGAVILRNRSALSEELRDMIPTDAVPLKKELNHRWIASLSLNLDTEQLKPRVQELLKSIR